MTWFLGIPLWFGQLWIFTKIAALEVFYRAIDAAQSLSVQGALAYCMAASVVFFLFARGHQSRTNLALRALFRVPQDRLNDEEAQAALKRCIRPDQNATAWEVRAIPFLPTFFLGRRRMPKLGEEDGSKPFQTATHGPSYLYAALGMVSLLVAIAIVNDGLASALRLAPQASVREYVLFGLFPYLGALLPLEQFPGFAFAFVYSLHLVALWILAAFVRVGIPNFVYRPHQVERPELPKQWRDIAGLREAYRTSDAHWSWMLWVLVATGVLFVVGVSFLYAEPYRLNAFDLAGASSLALAALLNRLLEGLNLPADEAPNQPIEQVDRNHWPDVVALLQRRYHIGAVRPVEPVRAIPELDFSEDTPSHDAASPLLQELLPDCYLELENINDDTGQAKCPEHGDVTFTGARRCPGKTHGGRRQFTRMQVELLEHTVPVLALKGAEAAGEHLSAGAGQSRHALSASSRDRAIVGPEGIGKTTTAMLLAFNHALSHHRRVLVIVAHRRKADELHARFRRELDSTLMRWQIGVSRGGPELAGELGKELFPDVVIATLADLIDRFLAPDDKTERWLERLDLILYDDMEDFLGAEQVHAQLAFRRLRRVLDRIQRLSGDDDQRQPVRIGFASTSMTGQEAFMTGLMGGNPVPQYFGFDHRESVAQRDAVQASAESDRTAGQEYHRLSDLRTKQGKNVTVSQLVEVLEELQVPWSVRFAGDENRGLSAHALPLRNEGRSRVEAVEDAAVVFIRGRAAMVRREWERLRRAGARFSRRERLFPGGRRAADKPVGDEIIAIVSLVDDDEDVALLHLERVSQLSNLVYSLPLPVHLTAGGVLLRRHLASDLRAKEWPAVAALADIYGTRIVQPLRRLAQSHRLQIEGRSELDQRVGKVVKEVYVHASSDGICENLAEYQELIAHTAHGEEPPKLPPVLLDIQWTGMDLVPVVDATTSEELEKTERATVPLRYYPWRVMPHASGRRQVTQTSLGQLAKAARRSIQARVEVEPITEPLESAPRRRIHVTFSKGEVDKQVFGREPVILHHGRADLQHVHLCSVLFDPLTHAVVERREEPGLFDLEPAPLQGYRPRGMLIDLGATLEGPLQGSEEAMAATLNIDDARLLTAAVRLAVGNVLRGGEAGLLVSLHVDAETELKLERTLHPREGIFIADIDISTGGFVEYLLREGLGHVLRVARLFIERCLHHGQLRTRWDYWGTAETVRNEALDVDLTPDAWDLRKEKEAETRKRVLTWLDLRLASEGMSEAASATGNYPSDWEEGEGQAFDAGRLWRSQYASVNDLAWVKHRWLTHSQRILAVDAAIDRLELAEHRDPSRELPPSVVLGFQSAEWTGAGTSEPIALNPSAGLWLAHCAEAYPFLTTLVEVVKAAAKRRGLDLDEALISMVQGLALPPADEQLEGADAARILPSLFELKAHPVTGALLLASIWAVRERPALVLVAEPEEEGGAASALVALDVRSTEAGVGVRVPGVPSPLTPVVLGERRPPGLSAGEAAGTWTAVPFGLESSASLPKPEDEAQPEPPSAPRLLDGKPSPGPTGALSISLEPSEAVQETLSAIFAGEVPAPTLANAVTLLDWMHRNIAYETDEAQYAVSEYHATPDETLASRRGDCEDHGFLMSALFQAMGVATRMVHIDGHAFAEIFIGREEDVDRLEAAKEISWKLGEIAALFELGPDKSPYSQGQVADGWVRDGDQYRRMAERYTVYTVGSVEVCWNIQDGECWLAVDTAMSSRYPGDLRQHIDAGAWVDGRWSELVGVHYPSAEGIG